MYSSLILPEKASEKNKTCKFRPQQKCLNSKYTCIKKISYLFSKWTYLKVRCDMGDLYVGILVVQVRGGHLEIGEQ